MGDAVVEGEEMGYVRWAPGFAGRTIAHFTHPT